MSETRLDPTAMGLLFIGFITLAVGLFGVDFYMNDGFFELIGNSLYAVALFGGLAVGVVAIFAYKANSNFGASTFGWVALSLLLVAASGGAFEGLFTLVFGANAWLLWIAVMLFYLVFAVWALLAGTPKLLVAILVVTALVFLFLGLAMNAEDLEGAKTMFLAMGIFGLLDFVLATYLGLALTEECAKCGKLKVF